MDRIKIAGFTPLEIKTIRARSSRFLVSTCHAFPRLKSNKKFLTGFTLLEIIVSLVMLSILAVGILSTVNYTQRSSMITQEKMIAIQGIERELTEAKRIGAAELQDNTNNPETKAFAELNGQITTTIKKVEGDDRLKEVLVIVNWTDPLGKARSESAVTLLYQE